VRVEDFLDLARVHVLAAAEISSFCAAPSVGPSRAPGQRSGRRDARR
jgi:hypothetical protein